MRKFSWLVIWVLVAGCGGDDDDTTIDGGATVDGTVTAVDSSMSGGGCTGAPPSDKACITLTVSNPVSYTGLLTPYASMIDSSDVTVMTAGRPSTAFDTHDMGRPIQRAMNISIGAAPLVQGMTYTIQDTANDRIMGNLLNYTETNVATITTKQFTCSGTVTVDSIVGKTHRVHFTAMCSGSAGMMTLTGEGAFTLP